MAAITFLADLFSTVWTVLLYSSPILIVVGIWVYSKMLKRWPVEAWIIEKRADNSLILTNDRLRKETTTNNKVKYVFQKAKGEAIIVPSFDWVSQRVIKPTNFLYKLYDILGTTVGTIVLYKYGSGQYKPVNLREELGDLKFEVVDWDNMNFLAEEQLEKNEKWKDKKNFLQAYLIPVVIIAAAILVFIFASYYGTQMWTSGQVDCSGKILANQQVQNKTVPGLEKIPGSNNFAPGQ